ncbi:MAG: PQQ-binding-like beta-propeller repeat protein [Chloroflexi bacterium]|nr:PQQ-binding-like beta-propeller repeat protein [Chloroflexota bacterium]
MTSLRNKTQRPETQRPVAVRRTGYARRRRRRLLLLGGIAFLLVSAVTVWNVFNLHLPVPPPSTALTPSIQPGDWATAGHDPQRTGYLPGSYPPIEGTLLWRSKAAGGLSAPPALAGGVLYLGSQDSRVIALDARTGDALWEQQVESPVDLPLAVAGGYVYAPLRNGRLLALDSESGATRWSFSPGDSFLAAPLIYGGSVYLSARDGRLYCLDAATGQKRWAYKLRAYSASSPATTDNILVAGTEDGNLHFLDSRNGTMRRLLPSGFPASSAPVLAGGRAFAIADDSLLIAASLHSREIPFEQAMRAWWWQGYVWGMLPRPSQPRGMQWLFTRRGESLGEGMAANEALLFLGSTIASGEGKLYVLRQDTGEVAWEAKLARPMAGAPIVVGETVYAVDTGGALYGLEAGTGKDVLRSETGAVPAGSPVWGQGVLYVATQAGEALAFR